MSDERSSLRRDTKRAQPDSAKLDGNARLIQLKKELAELSVKDQESAIKPSRPMTVAQVQAKGASGDAESIKAAAAEGIKGSGESLPHADRIQASFGGHDVSDVQAHVGGGAKHAAERMGAEAYASGSQVAFKSAPSLHTAAHEAAHVVQQRSGVQLADGVGRSGDHYEKHADSVADLVVQGKSAEDALSQMVGAPRASSGVDAVQRLGTPLDEELPEGAEEPEHGEKKDQRRYGFDQYIAMWEEDKGRKMTPEELKTFKRGCIGITVLNLMGSGNPPLNEAYDTFEQAEAKMKEIQVWITMFPDLEAKYFGPYSGSIGEYKAVMFAKLFWSNQKPLSREDFLAMYDNTKTYEENKNAYIKAWRDEVHESDPAAFPVDPETGKVDMTGYRYQSRPRFVRKGDGTESNEMVPRLDAEGNEILDPATNERLMYWPNYVNFDYGFWDEASQCFWHANHMQYEDPKMQVADPMIVLQSTKEKFIAGYVDFDRIIFCVGLQKQYDPKAAASLDTNAG